MADGALTVRAGHVAVRHDWHDRYSGAICDASSLSGMHWISGGGGVVMLAGRLSCDALLEGELSHWGLQGPCPHSVEVVIIKKDNDKAIYAKLAEISGPKPDRRVR